MPDPNDPFDLERFVIAQDFVFEQVIAELEAGRKASHWMWFVFPQIRGLGSSPRTQHYAISGRGEAVAYLEHEVLGPRLLRCTELVNAIEGRTAHQIFGSPDDVKFHSSMTLFSQCAADPRPFDEALARYFNGDPDNATVERL